MTGANRGYSLPVGSVHSLVTAAASLMEMQVAGGWQSPAMPGRCVQGNWRNKGAVARLRYGMCEAWHDPPAPSRAEDMQNLLERFLFNLRSMKNWQEDRLLPKFHHNPLPP